MTAPPRTTREVGGGALTRAVHELLLYAREPVARAGLALLGRLGIVLVASFAGNVAAARMLGPATIGRFALLLFVTQAILGPFGDLGLRAALIRWPGHLERIELASCQKAVLGFSALAGGVLASILPWTLPAVGLGRSEMGAGLVLLTLLVVRNLRVVPLSILEKEMRFRAVSAVESAEAIIYAATLTGLAYKGCALWSFILAMMARDTLGSCAIVFLVRAPWRGFSLAAIQPHLDFSLKFQAGAVLNMIANGFFSVGVGRLLGRAEVGYLTWAATVAGYPQQLCAALSRVYLPLFSRVVSERQRFAELVERTMSVNAMIIMPATAALVALRVPLIETVFGPRWLPAAPVLMAWCVAVSMSALGFPISEAFNAIGKVGLNLRLSAAWMVCCWVLGPLFAMRWGLNGVAIFIACLQITWVWAYRRARREFGARVLLAAAGPLGWALLMLVLNSAVVGLVGQLRLPGLAVLLVLNGLATATFAVVWAKRFSRVSVGFPG